MVRMDVCFVSQVCSPPAISLIQVNPSPFLTSGPAVIRLKVTCPQKGGIHTHVTSHVCLPASHRKEFLFMNQLMDHMRRLLGAALIQSTLQIFQDIAPRIKD